MTCGQEEKQQKELEQLVCSNLKLDAAIGAQTWIARSWLRNKSRNCVCSGRHREVLENTIPDEHREGNKGTQTRTSKDDTIGSVTNKLGKTNPPTG